MKRLCTINITILTIMFFWIYFSFLLIAYFWLTISYLPWGIFSKTIIPIEGKINQKKIRANIYNNVLVEIIYFKTNLERIAFQAMEDWKKTQKSPCDTKEKHFSFATTFPLNQGNHQRLELATNSVLDLSTLQTLIVRCS